MTLDPARSVLRLAAGVAATRTAAGVLQLAPPAGRTGWRRLFASRPRPVELDAVGTWVVERLEGRSLAALAEELATYLRLTRREAETALADFTRLLLARRLAVVEVSA
jgi:hypothetical protein